MAEERRIEPGELPGLGRLHLLWQYASSRALKGAGEEEVSRPRTCRRPLTEGAPSTCSNIAEPSPRRLRAAPQLRPLHAVLNEWARDTTVATVAGVVIGAVWQIVQASASAKRCLT